MKGRYDGLVHADHDLRRLRAEIESALRCGEVLDRIGVRFMFQSTSTGNDVKIEVCDLSGEALCCLTPRQLLDLVESGPRNVKTWATLVTLVGAVGPDGADRR